MGMYGAWLRVTTSELEQAMADPYGGHRVAIDTDEREYPPGGARVDLADRRSMGTDKSWQVLRYLLQRSHFPVDIVVGEHYLTEDKAVEWGYGRPLYLTKDEVQQAAQALSKVTEERLLDGVTAEDLMAEDLYPGIWGEPNGLRWAVSALESTRTWFGVAAAAGDAVICYIR